MIHNREVAVNDRQNDTTASWRTFTADEAHKLNEARTVLAALTQRARRGDYPNVADVQDGEISARADAAEWAVFQVLNYVNTTHTWPELGDDLVHNREQPRTVQVVFGTEGTVPNALGDYLHTDADQIVYRDADERIRRATQDCVTVVTVTLP